MPSAADIVFVFILVVVVSILEYVYFWPHLRADVAAGRPGARTRAYRRAVIGQWLFTLGAIAIWKAYARPWSALRLPPPRGWQLALGGGVVLVTAALTLVQLKSIPRLSATQRASARSKLADLAFMLPHTRQEEFWFLILSVTAGFCEELLYRGYLPWVFAPWLGAPGAMAAVVAIFGLSHAYQGRKGAVKATIAGAAMAIIVMTTGSLIPAMIVHALIDICGGTVGYWLLRDAVSAEKGPPARSTAAFTLAADG